MNKRQDKKLTRQPDSLVPGIALFQERDPRDGWYEITPSGAQWMLDHGVKNRPLSPAHAQSIAADIDCGEFVPNGEAIILNAHGYVLDGQHRLRACVISGRPIRSYIVFGVKESVFPTLDSAAKVRSAGDLAALMGLKHYNTAAAVARWEILYDADAIGKQGAPKKWMIQDHLKKHHVEIAAAVAEMQPYARALGGLVHPSLIGWVYYMARRQDPAKAATFLSSFANGAGLAEDNPVRIVRERFYKLSAAAERHTVKPAYRLALIVKAWNAYRAGRRMRVVKLVDGESFPRFNGEA